MIFTKKRWSITSILYVMFFFVIVMPIALVTSLSLKAYTDILLTNITSRTMQTLEQVSYTMDQENSRYMRTIASIAMDEKLVALATSIHRSKETTDNFDDVEQLENKMKSYLHDMPDFVSAMFVYQNGGAYYFEGTHFHNVNARISEDELKKTFLYQQALAGRGRVHMVGMEENFLIQEKGNYILSAAIAPKYDPAFYDVEMIFFVIQAKGFENLVQSRSNQEGSFIIVDDKGQVMLDTSGNPSVRGQLIEQSQVQKNNHFETTVNGDKMFVSFLTLDRTDWKIIYMNLYDQLTAEVKQIYRIVTSISIVGLLLFLCVSFFLVRGIVGPIKSLISQMNRVKHGSFDIDLAVSGPLEIYVLGNTFQNMIRRIQELIHDRHEQEKQKNRAEIDALQSQINPHFLVNTLNSIKIMGILSNATNIVEMTDSFIKLLSSTFHRGSSYLPLSIELQNMEKYIHIMKVRYGERFRVEYDIDEPIEQAYMLKMLLQPIVENAIIHGFYGKEAVGVVRIQGRERDQTLVITISDNGNGMEDDTIDTLLREKKVGSLSGIGVANVNDRIRLNYGDEYGLQISSERGEGTQVIVRLPLFYANPDMPIPSSDDH